MSKKYLRYTKKTAQAVCDLVADGKPFAEIEKMPGMPTRRTINNWMAKNQEFRTLFEETMRDKMNDISTELTYLSDKDNWPTPEKIYKQEEKVQHGVDDKTGEPIFGLPYPVCKDMCSAEISRIKVRVDILKTILRTVAGKFNTMYEAETTKVKHEGDLTTQHQIVIMDYSSKDIKTIDGEVLDDN